MQLNFEYSNIVDLSQPGLLGYNYGVKLNLPSMIEDHKISFFISSGTVIPNRTILCRLLVCLMKKDTTVAQRFNSEITEISLSTTEKIGLLQIPVNLRDMTGEELAQYRIFVGVHVQFVQPLDHIQDNGVDPSA